MDFVVAGFGVGAILMLLGFAVRDLGPLRFRSVEQLTPMHDEWLAMCRSVGTVLVIGGLVVCLATLVSLLVGAGDKAGSRSVMAIVAVAVIGCGIWSVLAIRRFVAMQPEAPDVPFERYGAFSSGTTSRPQPRSRRRANPRPEMESYGADELIGDEEVVTSSDSDSFGDDAFLEQESAVVSPPRRVSQPNVRESEPVAPVPPESSEKQPSAESVQPQISEQPTPPKSSQDTPSDSAPEPRFASRLLADVEDEKSEPAEGFRSTLLAGLDRTKATTSGGGFSSSIFSDLGRSANGSDVGEEEQASSTQDEDDVVDHESDTETVVTTTHEPEGKDEVSASQRSSASGTES